MWERGAPCGIGCFLTGLSVQTVGWCSLPPFLTFGSAFSCEIFSQTCGEGKAGRVKPNYSISVKRGIFPAPKREDFCCTVQEKKMEQFEIYFSINRACISHIAIVGIVSNANPIYAKMEVQPF